MVPAMGKRRFRAPQVRRFLLCVVLTATAGGLVSREYGDEVVGLVARLPASASGFQVLGWLFGGPPLLMAAMAWNDRGRFDADQRRKRSLAYGVWFGLGTGLLVPGLAGDAAELFGEAASTGSRLAFGWACGAVANAAAIAFATGIDAVHRRVTADGELRERALATRFVEVGWTVLLGLSLLFAAYGEQLGFVY